jgi:hypothetical protein
MSTSIQEVDLRSIQRITLPKPLDQSGTAWETTFSSASSFEARGAFLSEIGSKYRNFECRSPGPKPVLCSWRSIPGLATCHISKHHPIAFRLPPFRTEASENKTANVTITITVSRYCFKCPFPKDRVPSKLCHLLVLQRLRLDHYIVFPLAVGSDPAHTALHPSGGAARRQIYVRPTAVIPLLLC